MTTATVTTSDLDMAYGLEELAKWPHALMVPNGAQIKIVDTMDRERKKITIMLAANGIGKTMTLVAICANLMWPGKNPFFSHDLFTKWPYPKRIRIISSPRNITDGGSVQYWIDKLFPPGQFESFKGKLGYRWHFESNTGWEMQIFSNQLDRTEYAGPEFGLVGFDEPFSQSILGENLARTRAGGLALLTLTPVCEPGAEASELAWIKDRLVDGEEYDSACHIFDFEANCIQHGEEKYGTPGFLEHDDLLSAIEGCPAEEMAARKNGEFCLVGGLVHPTWQKNRDLIRIPDGESRFLRWNEAPTRKDRPTIYHVLDPHDAKPFVMLWLAVFPDNTCEFIAEYPDTFAYHKVKRCNTSLVDYVKIIDEIESGWKAPVRVRLIDARYGNQQVRRAHMQSTVKVELLRLSKRHGKKPLIFADSACGADSWKEARRIVSEKLNPAPPTNLPRWRALESMFNLDFGMCRHSVAARVGREADRHGDQGKPTDRYKCFPNCVEYLALANPRWRDPSVDVKAPVYHPAGAGDDYSRMTGT